MDAVVVVIMKPTARNLKRKGKGPAINGFLLHVRVITAVPSRVKATVIIKQPHVGRHRLRRCRSWFFRLGCVGDPDRADVSPGSDDMMTALLLIALIVSVVLDLTTPKENKITESKKEKETITHVV